MKLKKIPAIILALMLALSMGAFLSACGSDEPSDSDKDASNPDSVSSTTDAAKALDTFTPGKLTIATGDPAWAPWVLDDDPESGQGFEAALAYAVAGQLGFAKEDVVWVRSDFDPAIQPGPKDYDFNLQQFDITAARKEAVDFSSPYYKAPLVAISKEGNAFADAASIADLKDALIGVANGDVAVTFAQNSIKPTQDVQIYNNLADAVTALSSGQIDIVIADLLTGNYIVYIDEEQLPGGVVVGILGGSEDATEGLGLLLEKGSPLTEAVTKAVDALRSDGTLDKLKNEWLTEFDINVLG